MHRHNCKKCVRKTALLFHELLRSCIDRKGEGVVYMEYVKEEKEKEESEKSRSDKSYPDA
jgi:hypothetical protein